MVLPREKRLVRVYTELSPMASAQYAVQQNPEITMDRIAEIMQPWIMKTNRIDWYTSYKVLPLRRFVVHILNKPRLASGSAQRVHSTTVSSLLVMRSIHTRSRQEEE